MKESKCMGVIATAVAVIVLGVAVLNGGWAAEPVPPTNDAELKVKALNERVMQLEKRLAEMEANAANTAKAERTPKGRRFELPPQRFEFQQDDFNKMFEEMQRQLMQHGMLDRDFPNLPHTPMVPGFPGRASRPSLGVQLADITDELKTRFKNDVKDGVFVVSVLPNSSASQAGILTGDAITEFDGKAVASAKVLAEMIKNALKGPHDIMLSRHGELLKLKVDLAPQGVAYNDGLVPPGIAGDTQVHTEINVSALELSDALAQDLQLSDDQKKSMGQILTKHAKELSDEFGKSHTANQPGHMFGFTVDGNLSELSKKHADNAAKELAGVLSPAQLSQWNEYRNTHSSISFSHSMQSGKIGKIDTLKDKVEEDPAAIRF